MELPRLYLTTGEMRQAARELEGEHLPQRTLAGWIAQGLLTPSVRWDRKKGRAHACLFSIADLARLRLIVRLRRYGQLPMSRVRDVLAFLESELADALRPKTTAVLRVHGPLVAIVDVKDRTALTVPDGQYLLPLADVMAGNDAAARKFRTAA